MTSLKGVGIQEIGDSFLSQPSDNCNILIILLYVLNSVIIDSALNVPLKGTQLPQDQLLLQTNGWILVSHNNG